MIKKIIFTSLALGLSGIIFVFAEQHEQHSKKSKTKKNIENIHSDPGVKSDNGTRRFNNSLS